MSVATPGAPTHAANSGRRWNWPLSALASVAVAAILLLGAVSLFLLSEIAALRDSQLDLQAQLTARDSVLLSMQNAQNSLREQASARDAILIDVVATVGEHYQMIAAQADSPANADVAWVHDSNIAILTADQFPDLEPGRAYQLWLIRDGQRTSGGLFTVDSDGSATYIFSPPEPLESFQSMGITPEPAGGSSGPTAPPVVRGEL